MKILKYSDYMRDNSPSQEELDDYFLDYIDKGNCSKSRFFTNHGPSYNVSFYLRYEIDGISDLEIANMSQRLENLGCDFFYAWGRFNIMYDGKDILDFLDSEFEKPQTYKRDIDYSNKSRGKLVWQNYGQDLVTYDFSTEEYTIGHYFYNLVKKYNIDMKNFGKILSWYLPIKFDMNNKYKAK